MADIIYDPLFTIFHDMTLAIEQINALRLLNWHKLQLYKIY